MRLNENNTQIASIPKKIFDKADLEPLATSSENEINKSNIETIMSEQQNIEWKQSWHDDYLKWICGFANAVGGDIFIGRDDSGNVVHLTNFARLLDDIPNKIRNSMGIICDVQLHDEEGKKYISIKVNPYSVPVSLRGRYYYRSGSTKLELTGVELTEFLLKKSGKSWDEVPEEGAKITDIDEKSLSQFIREGEESNRMPDTKGLSTSDLLDKLRLLDGKKIKRAALILFGKDPNRFYPNIAVKIGRFGKDGSDLKFQEVIEGNLVYLLSEVETQLNYKFLTRKIDFKGLHRIEEGEYPVAALREMLLNALVHRTYMGASVQIRVFDNKLSIWNEGTLPIGMDMESLKRDHSSRPRNPKIADACFKAGYIDTWGRGTLKIINACKEAKLPEPEMSEIDGGIQITIFKDAIGGQVGGQVGGQAGGQDLNATVNLTDKQKAVFGSIVENPKISRSQLSEKLGINESAVQKHIEALKKKGFIEREGETTGSWKILI